jgi:hypothetical protein
MSNALKSISSDIIIKSAPLITQKKRQSEKTKQYVNGYEVKWTPQSVGAKAIPVIQDKNNTFYIQFPTQVSDITVPVGTVRATYNKSKSRVEYFRAGSDEPIKTINDQRHEPLPLPKYFSHIEFIEQTFSIDMTTGEIVATTKIDILPEEIHWKIRLQEFEKNQRRAGNSDFVIERKVNKYIKCLATLRGVTLEDLSKPLPAHIIASIENAKKQVQIRAF